MIECPACKHQEFVGTLYCSECGARLVHVSPLPSLVGALAAAERPGVGTKPAPPEGPSLESGAILGLRHIASGEILTLVGRDNYTLGRSVEGQAVIPDIDLARFEGYQHGVSRIHAELRLEEEGLFVVDLDSANGTQVNGKALKPQEPVAVRHGDIITLGQLKLQLISRYRG
jgi:hypothetical protein